MPDATIAEAPKAPTRVQVLTQTRHKVGVDTTTLSDSLRTAHEGNEAARKTERDNPANLEKSMGEISTTESFTQADLDEIKAKLELGDDDPTYKRLSSFASYLGAARQAETNGTNVEIELGGSWNSVRDAVVEGIIRDGKLLDKFPELSDITNPDEQKAYVEIVLARDPRLHNEIAQRVNAVLTGVKKDLPTDAENNERENLSKQNEAYGAVKTTVLESLSAVLSSENLPPEKIEHIKKLIEAGLDTETILITLEDTLIEAKGIKDIYFNLAEYNNALIYTAAIDQEIKDIDARLDSLPDTKQNQDEKRRLQHRRDGLSGQIKAGATEDVDDAKKVFTDKGMTEDQVNDALTKYKQVARTTKLDGNTSKQIKQLVENEAKVKSATRELEKFDSDPDKKAKTEKRAADKEKFKKDLQEALGKAVAGFLTKKFNDAASDQRIILTAAQKEAEKNGEKWSADALKTINNVLNGTTVGGVRTDGRWSTYNEATGKWTFEQAQLATDGGMLAARHARGEDGGRELMASFIGYSLDEATEKNKIAASQFGGRAYDALSDAEKVQADTVFNKRRADFDKLYNEQGDTIKNRFVTDLFRARGFTDKKILGVGLGGDLILTKEQYVLLNSYFGETMEKGLKNSKDAQKGLKALQEKGIIPDSKLKWLIYILLALGGAAALGTAGAAGVPLAGMAVGALGKLG